MTVCRHCAWAGNRQAFRPEITAAGEATSFICIACYARAVHALGLKMSNLDRAIADTLIESQRWTKPRRPSFDDRPDD